MCNNTDLVLFVAEIMRGLYLITNDDPIELLLAKLEGAMATYEVAVLQYRRKNVPQAQQAYEIEYMKSEAGEYPILLLDDVMSELDEHRRKALLEFVRQRIQTFITTTDVAMFRNMKGCAYILLEDGKVKAND